MFPPVFKVAGKSDSAPDAARVTAIASEFRAALPFPHFRMARPHLSLGQHYDSFGETKVAIAGRAIARI